MSWYIKPPAESKRPASIKNPTIRRLYESIERERVRQGKSMSDLDGGVWNIALRHPETIQMRTIANVIDALDMDVILINREGDQV